MISSSNDILNPLIVPSTQSNYVIIFALFAFPCQLYIGRETVVRIDPWIGPETEMIDYIPIPVDFTDGAV